MIAEPTPSERLRVPVQLLSIALKALASDSRQRYRDAGELLKDLRRYQSGLAVIAYRESLWQRWRRWHHRHARAFWSWTAAGAVVLALGAALLGERIQQIAYWGTPTTEPFDQTWTQRWLPVTGSFAVDQGRLVSQTPGMSVVAYSERIDGPTAIEFTGEWRPGSKPGDISLRWARKLAKSPEGRADLTDCLQVQIGAWNDTMTLLSEEVSNSERTLASCDFVPRQGKPFRARVEIEDARLTLFIDGREQCSWTDVLPLENGYLALWAQEGGEGVLDVRIYHRELPAKVPATAIGDAAARASDYELAESQYARVARSQAGTHLGREALFKQGLCHWRQHNEADAMRLWEALAGSEYADDIKLFRLQRLFDGGDHAAVPGCPAGAVRACDPGGAAPHRASMGRLGRFPA